MGELLGADVGDVGDAVGELVGATGAAKTNENHLKHPFNGVQVALLSVHAWVPSLFTLAEPHLGVTSTVAGTSTSMLESLQTPCAPVAPSTGLLAFPVNPLTEQQKLRSYPCSSAVATQRARHCSPRLPPPSVCSNCVYVLLLRLTSHRLLAALVKLLML